MKIINSLLGVLLLLAGLNASAEALVRGEMTCSSDNQQPRTCYVGPYADIQFSHQISKAACINGQSMFVYRDQINVNSGCRAVFIANQAVDRVSEYDRIIDLVGDRSFSMRFDTDGIHRIPYYPIANIYLEARHSSAPCNYGQGYMINRDSVILRNGCRATFRIRGY